MDVEMRRMNGLKATMMLTKQYPQDVIVVTNHQDAQTRQAAREAGARFFLGKDDLMLLRQIIR